MKTLQKVAVALGLAGAATAYAMNGEVRAVYPINGKPFAEVKARYGLPFEANGFTLVDASEGSYYGLTDVSKRIVGPLSGKVRIGHAGKPISGLEAGLDVVIPTGKLPAFADAYALHSVNSNTGTMGAFGTIGKDVQLGKVKGRVSVDALAEMSYSGLKPTFFYSNIEPSIEVGKIKVGYDLNMTSAGIGHKLFAGLKI